MGIFTLSLKSRSSRNASLVDLVLAFQDEEAPERKARMKMSVYDLFEENDSNKGLALPDPTQVFYCHGSRE